MTASRRVQRAAAAPGLEPASPGASAPELARASRATEVSQAAETPEVVRTGRRAQRPTAAPDLERNAALRQAAAEPAHAEPGRAERTWAGRTQAKRTRAERNLAARQAAPEQEGAAHSPKPHAAPDTLHATFPAAEQVRGDLPAHAIVLVGPMAAGKTSIGRRVARELGIPFIDSDARIVQAHGPIPEIFEVRGEPAFREIEAATIAEELAEPGARILALGGGAVLDDETRERLRAHPVILLMTTERAVKRTANLTKRPLLREDPGAWSRILEERRPLYESVSDVTFRTDRASKEQLVRRIAAWILHPEARGTQDEGVDE